jgi:flagellar protein FlgJ
MNGFANGLQRAGYATDPRYAEKLTRIIRQS